MIYANPGEAGSVVSFEKRYGNYIGGEFVPPVKGQYFDNISPVNGKVFCEIPRSSAEDIEKALDAAHKAAPAWGKTSVQERSNILLKIADRLEQNLEMLAVAETWDNGKAVRETLNADIPLAVDHFRYFAGCLRSQEGTAADIDANTVAYHFHEPLGVVGQIIPWNFPILMAAWKLGPALAAGNCVVLKPAEQTPASILKVVEVIGDLLPPGVLNIVNGFGAEAGQALATSKRIAKIAFTGSTEVGRKIRQATAGRGIGLTLELGGKSPYVVFEDADLDSAIEGLVDAIWFNQGQVCCAGSRLLVQEGVADAFHDRLRARMDKLRIGNPLDKCIDVGAIVAPEQLRRIEGMVSGAEGTIYRANCPLPEGCYYPPTLISGLSSASPLMQEEIFGPVLVSSTFRTPAEAVALANNTRYGLAASVWSENINTALDVAPQLAAGVVWVNGTNMFDAAAGFGGVRESGFGREGGWEGLRAYTRPRGDAATLAPVEAFAGDSAEPQPVDRTAKLYIGGKQARPDGGYARNIHDATGKLIGQAPFANRKDIRNAVEAARGAGGWAKATAHNRAQVLYYIGENLSARAGDFAALIDRLTGDDNGAAEVEASVNRLFTAAAWADKFDGGVRSVPMRGVALAMNEPCGVIGALCADEAPLLGLVSVMAPAIAMGNRVVLIASDPFPLAALEFTQVLETSDVPGGVVNILTGAHVELAPVLAAHMDVEAVWSFSSSDLSEAIETASAGNLKRTWVNDGRARDWQDTGDTRDFLEQATEVKTVWVPYGA